MPATLARILAVVSLLVFAGPVPAAPIVIVTPNAQAAAEGNTGNSFPFGSASHRYQQIYGAEAFGDLPGPSELKQIAFRPNGANTGIISSNLGKAFSGVFSMSVHLSTSSDTPDNLPSTFDAAHGADKTMVVSGAALSSGFTGPAGGPKDFDIVLPLQSPFVYDPAAGSLLMEVRIWGISGDTGGYFDVQEAQGDSVSRSWAQDYNAGGGSRDTRGLVTQFTFVPEPATLALLGAAGLMLRRRGRRSAAV